MDSGASFHISNNENEINNLIPTTNECVQLPNGKKIPVKGTGTVTINAAVDGDAHPLTFKCVRYIPTLETSFISEIALAEDEFEIRRKGNHVEILKDDQIIAVHPKYHGSHRTIK